MVAVLWHFFYLLIRFCFSTFYPKPKCHGNISKSGWSARVRVYAARVEKQQMRDYFPFFFFLFSLIKYADYSFCIVCIMLRGDPSPGCPCSKGLPDTKRAIAISMEGGGRWTYFETRRNYTLNKNNCSVCWRKH